jgi:EKC/KEOPS complex subunit PCC1/LAGE3
MNEELTCEITIPFACEEHAKIAYNTLSVDAEPRKEQITKRLTLNEKISSITVNWCSKEAKLLRVSVNSFIDHLCLVLEAIELFGN